MDPYRWFLVRGQAPEVWIEAEVLSPFNEHGWADVEHERAAVIDTYRFLGGTYLQSELLKEKGGLRAVQAWRWSKDSFREPYARQVLKRERPVKPVEE